MSEKRFTLHLPIDEKEGTMGYIVDKCNKTTYFIRGENARKDLVNLLNGLAEENEQLRLELETHKHPLWSTREAERKVNKLADSLADEVKKNGLLNEEINQLRIENMRLKKKGGDSI